MNNLEFNSFNSVVSEASRTSEVETLERSDTFPASDNLQGPSSATVSSGCS